MNDNDVAETYDDSEQVKAQEALEAQLKYTAGLIQRALGDHPHFTDDCGEYLRGALELSAMLVSNREDGIESLVKAFEVLSTQTEEVPKYREIEQYPSDSVAPEVYAITGVDPLA